MRPKGEILSDALTATEKPITDVRSHVKLTILNLEVQIDIRDELSTTIDVLRSLRDEIHELP